MEHITTIFWCLMTLHFLRFSIAHKGHRCGTKDPTPQQIEESDKVASRWTASHHGRSVQDVATSIEIPVCIHVMRPTEDPNPSFLDEEGLQRQLDALNKAYSSLSCCDASQWWCNSECSVDTGVRFGWALLDDQGLVDTSLGVAASVTNANTCVTRTNNDDWFTANVASDAVVQMKRDLRQGDASVLNIYVKVAQDFGEDILGFATFPDEYYLQRHLDGVVIDDEVIAGGTSDTYAEGVRICR